MSVYELAASRANGQSPPYIVRSRPEHAERVVDIALVVGGRGTGVAAVLSPDSLTDRVRRLGGISEQLRPWIPPAGAAIGGLAR